MLPPPVRVNTFLQNTTKLSVDIISKFFIYFELTFGVYRLAIVGHVRRLYHILASGYFILINILVISMLGNQFYHGYFQFSVFFDALKFFVCNILNFSLRKRLLNFYKELNKFDLGIGYENTISRSSIQNMIHMAITFTVSLAFIFAIEPSEIKYFQLNMSFIIPIKIFHALELHYFAHLITVISPRIRMIVHYMKVSFPPNKNYTDYNTYCDEDFRRFKKRARKFSRIEMDVLMDLYHNIITAYDYLNSAIKWQMLLLLVVSFSVTLVFLYEMATIIISGNFILAYLLIDIGLISLEIIPIFATCLFSDQVCKEVRQLREMLSCSLYENILDKQSRTAAQAFMALTEARDLSFTLFHMFNVDISLPFKILGLLLTYLIILLQFDKVINPTPTKT